MSVKDSVTIKRVLLYFIPFIPSIIFGAFCNSPAMSIAAGIGFVILLLINIDKLKSIKGLGIEAKMREVDGLLKEGNVILEKLKDLAVGVSEPILSDLGYKQLSIMKKLSTSYLLEQYENIIKLLTNLDIEKLKIEESSSLFVEILKYRYVILIKQLVIENREKYEESKIQEIESIKIELENKKSYKLLLERVHKINNLDKEIENIINHYEHFVKTGEIKNNKIFDS